jgi:hypothetical protein
MRVEIAGAAQPAYMPEIAAQDAGTPPSVSVSVKPVDCGKCFELEAAGSGGQPPYVYTWENGSPRAQRYVCVDTSDLTLTVVARDAAGTTSSAQTIQLAALGDAACPEPMQPAAAMSQAAVLCLENPSFEGTPAANLGQPGAFQAPPWSTCVRAAMAGDTSNVPAIADANVAAAVVPTPNPTEGLTYLALGEGQQVSQPVCSSVDTSASFTLELDLASVDLTQGLSPPTEQVFLEIWGGLTVDCSQRELLWASPALTLGWKHYCVLLRPHAFMDQITLRGSSDMTSASPSYMLVDNLKPSNRCP